MTIEQAVDTYLRADATLASLIGGRLYWIQADQTATLPYVVYQKIIDVDDPVSFGARNTGNVLIQFSCVGATRSTVNVMYRIRELMRGAIIMADTLYPSLTLYPATTLYPASGERGYSNTGSIREVYNPDTNRYVFYLDYEIAYEY